jgi:hypothetical protein
MDFFWGGTMAHQRRPEVFGGSAGRKKLRITFRLYATVCGPDKEMRSISRADKLCRSNGVGMFPSIAGARSVMT